MRLYRVSVSMDSPLFESHTEGCWVGTQSDAAKERRSFNSAGVKRDHIVTEEVEVPTNKSGLIEFLNRLEQGIVGGLAQGSEGGEE